MAICKIYVSAGLCAMGFALEMESLSCGMASMEALWLVCLETPQTYLLWPSICGSANTSGGKGAQYL